MAMGFLPPIFPDHRGAAVSLTYDDGLPEHLDHAIPDLETLGLRGTFYVPTQMSPIWNSRADEWRSLAARGHEIGNHTRYHPCSIKHEWIKPNFSLEAYNLGRIERELLDASADLDEITGPQVRSYAYTCCEDFVGPERTSFRPMVARLFPAARAGGRDELADPRGCDLNWVPSWAVSINDRRSDLIAFIDRAIEQQAWAVLMFHGVGGGHGLNCRREVHREICLHIADRKKDIYCDTFVNVATVIRKAVNKPWNP